MSTEIEHEKKRGLFTNKANQEAEIFLYDAIGEDMFGGISARAFAEALRSLRDIPEITVRINSPGGEVWEADAIYNLLVQDKAKIHVRIDGVAASAASYVAMAGDTIKIAENAKFMVHNPRAGVLVMGEAATIRKAAEKLAARLDITRDAIILTYQKRTKKDSADIGALMDAETWYTGQKAVDAGFVDAIIPAKTVDMQFDMLAIYDNVPEELFGRHKNVVAQQFEEDYRRRKLALYQKKTA